MRNYIWRVKNFFRGLVTGGRQQVVVKGGADLVLAEGARLMLGGAAGDDYISRVGGGITIYYGGVPGFRGSGAINYTTDLGGIADNTHEVGRAAFRYTAGLFSTEIGIHDGTNFSDSLVANSIKLGGAVSVASSGTNIKVGIDGGAGKFLQMPSMTTVEAGAIGGANGDMYYDTTLNQIMVFENGAFRNA